MTISRRIAALAGDVKRRDITFHSPVFRKMRSVLNRELAQQLKKLENRALSLVSHKTIGNHVWAILKGAEPMEQLMAIAAKNEKAGQSLLLEFMEFHIKLIGSTRDDIGSTSAKYPFFIPPWNILDIMTFDRKDMSDWALISGIARQSDGSTMLKISVINAIKRTYSSNDREVKLFLDDIKSDPRWSAILETIESALREMERKKMEEDRQIQEALATEKALQKAAEAKRAERIAKIKAKAAERRALKGEVAIDPKKAKGVMPPIFSGLDEELKQAWDKVIKEGKLLLLFAGASSEKRFRGLLAGKDQSHNMEIWARQRNEAYLPMLRAYLNFQLALNRRIAREAVFYRNPSPALLRKIEADRAARAAQFPSICDPRLIMRAMGLKR